MTQIGTSSVAYINTELYSCGFNSDGTVMTTTPAFFNTLSSSGFTTVIAWTLHIDPTTADLILNNTQVVDNIPQGAILCSNGNYVDTSNFANNMNGLSSSSYINQVLFGLGSAPVGYNDFATIYNWIEISNNQNSTSAEKTHAQNMLSTLADNFNALIKAIPIVAGFDFDDEGLIVVDAIGASKTYCWFAEQICVDPKKIITFCPFGYQANWLVAAAALITLGLAKSVSFLSSVNLQMYAGGQQNDNETQFGTWVKAFGSLVPPIPVSPLAEVTSTNKKGTWTSSPTSTDLESTVATWTGWETTTNNGTATAAISSAGIWLYDNIPDPSSYAAAIATGLVPKPSS